MIGVDGWMARDLHRSFEFQIYRARANRYQSSAAVAAATHRWRVSFVGTWMGSCLGKNIVDDVVVVVYRTAFEHY